MRVKNRPEYSNSEFVKDLWHFIKVYKREFIFYSLLLAFVGVLGLAPPIILAKIIDFFILGENSTRIFYIYLSVLIGILIFSHIFRLGAKHYLALFTNKIQKHAKVDSFQKLIQNDLVWHDKENTGNKMEKISAGEKAIGSFMDFYTNQGIEIVITVLGIIAVFSFFNIKYGLLAVFFMITYLTVEFKLNKKVARKTLEQKIAMEKATGKAYEFSSNIQTVKSMGMERSSKKQIKNKEEIVRLAKKAKREASTKRWIAVQIISTIFYGLFIFLVGKDILLGVLTVGSIVIYIEYSRRLSEVLNKITHQTSKLIDIKYSIFRFMKIYKTIPEIKEEGAKNLRDWNEIKIKNVGFKYGDEDILKDFSLDIKKGERIGIVGRSGSGKSTLFKLLLKLYLPQKGTIHFDNKSITKLKRDSILEKISIVPQETEVFNFSLRNNILIAGKGKKNYPLYEKALILSKLSKVISKLKNKDLSPIGEKGVRLSGGERQRLGIARAIYKDSEIIIFDEATSNLDYETEKKIQESINKLKNKTLIISAHRLSTLTNMDKIIFLEKGRIAEQGTYEELLEKKGKFYMLWKQQNRERLK